jgi:hypothetical protein
LPTSVEETFRIALDPLGSDAQAGFNNDAVGYFDPQYTVEGVMTVTVPEPVTVSLLVLGGCAILLKRRRSA